MGPSNDLSAQPKNDKVPADHDAKACPEPPSASPNADEHDQQRALVKNKSRGGEGSQIPAPPWNWAKITGIATVLYTIVTVALFYAAWRQASISSETFFAEERAWLQPLAPQNPPDSILANQLPKGQPIMSEAAYKNLGHEPALDVNHTVEQQVILNSQQVALIAPYSVCKHTAASLGPVVSYPDEVVQRPIMLVNTNSIQFAQISSGKAALYIEQCLTYLTLGQVHHSFACYFLHVSRLEPALHWSLCPEGNSAD